MIFDPARYYGKVFSVELLSKVHLSCFLLSYLVAFGGELYQLLRGRSAFTRGLLLLCGSAGLLAHTVYLYNRSSESGLPPLVGSSHDWLLVLAWLTAVIYLVVIAVQERVAIGVFILPALIGLVVMAMFVEDSAATELRKVATRRWGMLHAATLVMGIGSVAAATLCGAMYLLQYQKLRGRKSILHRLQLPSLEQLTSLNRWLVVGTVVMLTIGLLTGVILGAASKIKGGTFQWLDPVVIGTTAVWLLMVGYLFWLLTQKEQTGRQVARLTLVAGGFLLLTIFGLMLLAGGVHGTTSADAETTSTFITKGSGISAEL